MTLMNRRKLRTLVGTGLLAFSSSMAMPAAAQAPMGSPIPGGPLAGTPAANMTPASATAANAPAATATAALPKKMYSKSADFNLPIQMEEATRLSLQEVQLWVKAPGTAWTRQDRVPPTAHQFRYHAVQDGEYWFNLVTIDKQGRTQPANMNLEPPGLRVVVDTKAPLIDVQLVAGLENECVLACTVQDANPDPASLRGLGKGNTGELPLEAAGQAGVFRVRAELMAHPIRLTATDLAGNLGSREIHLKDLYAAAGKAFPIAALPPVTNSTPPLVKPSLPDPIAGQGPVSPPALVPVPALEKTPTTANNNTPPAIAPAGDPKMPVLPSEITPVAAKGGPANRRLIGTTNASIDYRIDQAGPSGVGKVEVYITHDHGNSWRRVGEDSDRQSPAEVNLPGEGMFGIRLAITNGNGFGGTPPARGDTPHCWVEVDTTPPFVQLRPPEVVPNGGALDIRWSASDPNIGAEPVSLYYRTKADAPWQSIARGVKNDGVYRWTFPRDGSSQYMFKVEVTDMAGNVGRAESQTPVILDMTEPRASVIGITGMGKTTGGN